MAWSPCPQQLALCLTWSKSMISECCMKEGSMLGIKGMQVLTTPACCKEKPRCVPLQQLAGGHQLRTVPS